MQIVELWAVHETSDRSSPITDILCISGETHLEIQHKIANWKYYNCDSNETIHSVLYPITLTKTPILL